MERDEESAAQITSSFAQSDEYSSRAKSVSELYFLLFERVPDSEGMRYWLDEVDKGLSIDALVEMFMASDEYASKYAGVNDDEFLTLLVEQGTGQSVDGDEESVFSEQLTTGGRAGLVRYIADTQAFEQQHGDAIQVTSLYQGVLSRAPSAEELRSATTSSITLIDELYSRSDYVGEVVPQVGESTASNSSTLSNLVQTQGMTINGPSNHLFIGDQVSEAGDVNGDAVDDLLFASGNPLQAGDTQTVKRVINLLYGKKDDWDARVDLAILDSTRGAIITTPRISTHTNGNECGLAESVGDIKNDGVDDLALLNLYGDDGRVRNITLLYGQSSDWDAQLILEDSINPAITEITTIAHEKFEEVRSVGDFNGDGIADLMCRMSGSTENQIGGIVF